MPDGVIKLGQVAFVDKGAYSETAEYRRFDFVVTGDSTYLSLVDENTGHPVTDGEWWKCLADGKPSTIAATLATEKAGAAESAAERAVAAIEGANTAASNASEKAQDAGRAAADASDRAAEVRDALERLSELERTLTAKDRRQPTAMELEYPARIVRGSGAEHRIAAMLTPEGTGSNVLYLTGGGDGAVTVMPDGYIVVNGVGRSLVHVIPTENTAIYRTVTIEVMQAPIRLVTKSSIRLASNGALRLN